MQPAASASAHRTVVPLLALVITLAALSLGVAEQMSFSLGGSVPGSQVAASAEPDVAAMSRILHPAEALRLDDAPNAYLCDRAAGVCWSGIDAANLKTGCTLGDVANCRVIASMLALECQAGRAPSCASLHKLRLELG